MPSVVQTSRTYGPELWHFDAPATYPADGIVVDRAGAYSQIDAAFVMDARSIATGLPDARNWQICEVGADSFANLRFVVKGYSPAGGAELPAGVPLNDTRIWIAVYGPQVG